MYCNPEIMILRKWTCFVLFVLFQTSIDLIQLVPSKLNLCGEGRGTRNNNKLAKLRRCASRVSFVSKKFRPNQPAPVTNSLTKLDSMLMLMSMPVSWNQHSEILIHINNSNWAFIGVKRQTLTENFECSHSPSWLNGLSVCANGS